MNNGASVLIDGIALLIVADGGHSLAHWIQWATDAELVFQMRQWAEAEIVRQAELTRQQRVEDRRKAMHVVTGKEV